LVALHPLQQPTEAEKEVGEFFPHGENHEPIEGSFGKRFKTRNGPKPVF